MSLMKREPSLAQIEASRANSRRSTGPRSGRGKIVSSRNARKPRLFSEVVAHSMESLGESPGDFERMHEALAQAMEPRDAWEASWVQDIAILRRRLECLQRAEYGDFMSIQNEKKRSWELSENKGSQQVVFKKRS